MRYSERSRHSTPHTLVRDWVIISSLETEQSKKIVLKFGQLNLTSKHYLPEFVVFVED